MKFINKFHLYFDVFLIYIHYFYKWKIKIKNYSKEKLHLSQLANLFNSLIL